MPPSPPRLEAPMSEHDRLSKAVLDDPEDDTPRLIYADWLDDNGDPGRADFIRVQVERARLPEGDARHGELARREGELFREGFARWEAKLPAWARPRAGWLEAYRRGFVTDMICTAKQWMRGAAKLLRVAPV